jgi:regulator of RNase E activity RraA
VGRALTIRYLPRRPDLDQATRALARRRLASAYNVRAAEEAKRGDVIVVDLGGGFPMAFLWRHLGIGGADGRCERRGAVRLYAGLHGAERDERLPVRRSASIQGRDAGGVDWNVPIRVGGATVLPGDVVVGDAEAVLFFPTSIVEKVIERATQIVDQETYERKAAREKKYRFRDVYPLSPELRKKYEAERKQQQ